MMSGWLGWLKGAAIAAATLVLTGSDLAGIQHSTVAKTIAGLVLAALAGDATAKNHAAAKAALRDGVVIKDSSTGPQKP